MDYLGGNGFAILFALVISVFISIGIPFFMGFFLSFFILKHNISNKKGKFYIKSKDTRLLISLGISLLVGALFAYLVITLDTLGYLRF
jgi:hypothetical protein